MVNGAGCGRRGCGGVVRACERSCARARRVWLDWTPDPSDGGRSHLREFDGDAGLARRSVCPHWRWLLGLGIVATLAANVVHGLGHGLIGAAVAAWPAVALVGSYELLMVIIRGAQCREVPGTAGIPDGVPDADPLQVRAARVFGDELAAAAFPRCALSARLHVEQPRAQRVQAYVATFTSGYLYSSVRQGTLARCFRWMAQPVTASSSRRGRHMPPLPNDRVSTRSGSRGCRLRSSRPSS